MNFGQAIEAIKAGKRAARDGWNGKGMFIYLNKGAVSAEEVGFVPGSEVPANLKTTIDGVSLSHFEMWSPGIVTRLPNINMRSATGSTVTGWLASQTDMLAEDWNILD